MNGLAVYVKEGFPLACVLSLEKSEDSYSWEDLCDHSRDVLYVLGVLTSLVFGVKYPKNDVLYADVTTLI